MSALSVTDRAALSDLVHRYAANVDDRQFDSVAELFAPTAELTVPEPPAALRPVHSHRGRPAIAAAVAAVAQTERTQHAIVGEVYGVLSEEGPRPAPRCGRIACIAHHFSERADELIDVVWHLRYDDEYDAPTPAGGLVAGLSRSSLSRLGRCVACCRATRPTPLRSAAVEH